MQQVILGIDQGTTGTRAMIFDHDINIIASAYSEFTQYFPQSGWVEHDASEIWDVTMKMVAQALKEGGVKPEQIAAIGITNQRETTVFWDKETGEPACRAMVWQDRRTLPICEALEAADGAAMVERTGMIIVPNDAATKIRWYMQNDENVRKGVEQGRLIYGTMDTWLIWKLSGGAVHVTDTSNNSVTLLQNATTLDYDQGVLDALEIPREILPKICGSSEVYAHTDPAVFFGASVPIAGILGDQQAAALGQGCMERGMAKNTYGTGSFMVMNTGGKYVPPSDGIFSPVLYSIGDRTDYCLEGMADVSGAVIQWLRDGLDIIEHSADAEKLALQVEDSMGVYFVPAFVGLGAPYYDSYARGTIIGISRGTTKHHIARAALESMAYQVCDAFKVMEQKSGLRLEKLRADGGGASSDFMLQFQADILGVPVERPVITETTTLGAVYMAGLAVGYWDSIEEVSKFWRIEKRFEPQISEEKREELCYGWNSAIERAGCWLKR
ncbi:glycerol kinase GlpK [Eubacterium sp. 1001713B170207_170306_E7]|uniref:glycerol kinase GlpK n=1 Tax=Eubacterium sp. 1001713B170207_170306_E7 TaxID=2787097 RepID=UPI001897D12A|nr:glycerol kinase GlpK [Eubacterium sp. 1001713B170207_170306_E7]